MIGFWDFKLSGAQPLLSWVVRPAEGAIDAEWWVLEVQ